MKKTHIQQNKDFEIQKLFSTGKKECVVASQNVVGWLMGARECIHTVTFPWRHAVAPAKNVRCVRSWSTQRVCVQAVPSIAPSVRQLESVEFNVFHKKDHIFQVWSLSVSV